MLEIVPILNTLTAALLVGAFKLMLDLKTDVAIAKVKIDDHHDRLEKLEAVK